MKRCSKCGTDRPRSEFQRKAAAYDGLRSDCKPCSSIAEKKRWQRTKAKKLKKQKAVI